jgi:hypothetical protein
MDEQKQILKMAADIANMDLEKLVTDHVSRMERLDHTIEVFHRLEQAFRDRLKDMDEAIDNLKALHQINMRVLNLINAPTKTGEPGEKRQIPNFI